MSLAKARFGFSICTQQLSNLIYYIFLDIISCQHFHLSCKPVMQRIPPGLNLACKLKSFQQTVSECRYCMCLIAFPLFHLNRLKRKLVFLL